MPRNRSSSHTFRSFKVRTSSSQGLDIPLFLTVVFLSIFGLVMVYDSSVVQAFKDYGDKYYYIRQQLIWTVLGFMSMIFFSYFDYRRFKDLSSLAFIGAFILLIMVFIPGLGVKVGGAYRWLRVFGFTLQPTEIIKLTSVIIFARIFETAKVTKHFFYISIGVTLIIGLFQKDLGSAIVYFLVSQAMYAIAGAPTSYFLAMIPASVIGFIGFVLSSPYRKHRILAFIDPFSDPQGYSYHISQVLIALGSGGLFGLGLGQSKQKFEYIPEVSTDSIFAIVGEELGFFGCLVLISLFTYLIYRGMKIARGISDRFGMLLGLGIIIWLGIQAIINLGAMVALFPLTGVPLPFISYGGSALLVNLTAIGILLNISKQSNG